MTWTPGMEMALAAAISIEPATVWQPASPVASCWFSMVVVAVTVHVELLWAGPHQ